MGEVILRPFPPTAIEIIRRVLVPAPAAFLVLVHETHIPYLVKGTPILSPRVRVYARHIHYLHLVARVPQSGHAMEKSPLGSIETVVVKEDAVSEKGGNEGEKHKRQGGQKKKPPRRRAERFWVNRSVHENSIARGASEPVGSQ
jgi:hypothetical protein